MGDTTTPDNAYDWQVIPTDSTATIGIQPAVPGDAADFLHLQRTLDAESLMSYEPDERQTTLEQTRQHLTTVWRAENKLILVAADTHGALYGYAAAYGGGQRRNRHRAAVTVAVLAGWRRRGIASRLITGLRHWAIGAGIVRFELAVMEGNQAGIHFWRSQGFETEGNRWDSIKIGGRYYNELWMSAFIR